jgi:hypothetical protein
MTLESLWNPAADVAGMTRDEIFCLARKMARQLRNGLTRAAHYLRSLGVSVADACRVLLGI